MNKKQQQLERQAKNLAHKFYEDAQALFDHPDMEVETAEGEVFSALLVAQYHAEDVENA